MSQTILETVSGGMTSIENQSAIQSLLESQTVVEATTTQVEDEDFFQCGKCKKQFNSLQLFLSHKQERCAAQIAPRSLVQNAPTLLQSLGTSAFTAIGVQNGIRTQQLPQTLNGFTAVSQASLPQITQNIVIPDEQMISFGDLQPVQNSLMQGSIQLAPAAQPATTYLGQMTRLAPRPQNNVTILSAVQPTTSLSQSPDSAFTSTVSMTGLQPLVTQQPQHNISITTLPDKTNSIQIIKPSPIKQGKSPQTVGNAGAASGIANSRVVPNAEIKKKLICNFCNKEFTKNFDLQQHIRSHTGEKPFQCVVCGRAFAQKSNVKKHMSTHKVWPSGMSGLTLPVQPPATLVPVDEEDASATKTTKPAGEVEDGTEKEEEEVDVEEGSKTRKAKTKKGNYKLKVVIDSSFVCQYCPEKFKSYYQLKSHMVNHKNVQVYKCVMKDCTETFKNLDAFLEHVKTHSDDMTYRCHQCNEVFNTLYELGMHQYTHELFETGNKSGPSYFQCTFCMNKYSTPEGLSHHMSTTNHECVCPHCDKTFKCERFLRKHLATHGTENLFQCSTCNKMFKSEYYLKNHILIHTGEKPFTCDHCGASFNRKDKLKRHALIHDKQARFKCPFTDVCGCTKEFSRPDKLKAHMLTHSNVKPFVCEICGREFTRRAHFNEHMRGHKGDYPYRCSKCKKGFFRPKLLREHRCPGGTEGQAHHRMFRPRRVKRKPGRPRKVVKKVNSASYADAKDIVVVNPGNLHENQTVIEKVMTESKKVNRRGRLITAPARSANKVEVFIDEDVNVKCETKMMKDSAETEGEKKANDGDSTVEKEVVVSMLGGSDNIMFVNGVPEQKMTKTTKNECYVKAPPASIATAPMNVVERYITLHFTTGNNEAGEPIQAQLIATGDLANQIQFPAALQTTQLGLANNALHPIQIIEGQPYTLAVSQGETLGDVSVGSNVIDIPVDIVTVPNDQTLVCTQEEGAEGVTEGAAQVYEIEDYGAGDTVLQGSENLIDTSVEIIGPENM